MGILIITIGLIPIVLAFAISQIFKGSKLSKGLFIGMCLLAFWQFYIGVLYFEESWNEDVVLLLFRMFRFGPIFTIPTLFYLISIIIQDEPMRKGNNRWIEGISKSVFNKKNFYLLLAWSVFVYLVDWTTLGIAKLNIVSLDFSSIKFYYPVYGTLGLLFKIHMASFVLILTMAFIILPKLLNANTKNFLMRFSIYAVLFYTFGLLNFHPATGMITGSIGVILFSTLIMLEFVKLNTNMKLNYHELMERQKKLDYTGSLTASLIHEVKNTNQIIKGFSKMLNKIEFMTDRDNGAIEMIMKSSEHLRELADNYQEYMKASKIVLKVDDLKSVIYNAIEMSQEITKERHVEIEFINHFKPLKAYINKTYLEQVFINLIKNSVEAIPEGKEIKKITIRTEVVDKSILIHFWDTGNGIPFENWESVFNPFMSNKDSGMGLGLPFVKKVLIEHLGNISIVESTAMGTHFQIELPQNGLVDLEQLDKGSA
ncbi:sensor histidine kinase [Oceanobacillus chungangensis]|uniref:histidine kinase n=2 Tax=Oceanobacillus chungangensis TaxID=1229152 RepID=A0A3D8PWK1_9BACI|nr:sensor histidine kinase [Oceanobacillus chungangensis]